MNNCKICGSESKFIFVAPVLGKYKVKYFSCSNCNFIQTEEPYWLQEAYNTPITFTDVGLLWRNLHFSNILPPVLEAIKDEKDAYLDYAGGYGVFVRLMRDKGYNFFLQEPYTENLFAKLFEQKDYSGDYFTALTAFEVFEHLADPVTEVEKMLALGNNLIFSTELQPQDNFTDYKEWWYFMPETGQHVSFFNLKSLSILSDKMNCFFYSNGTSLHLFTKQKLDKNPFLESKPDRSFIARIKNKINPPKIIPQRESLLLSDYEKSKKYLIEQSAK